MAHADFSNGLNTTAEEIRNSLVNDTDETHQRHIIKFNDKPIGEMNYRNKGRETAEIGIKIRDFTQHEKGLGTIVLSMFIDALFFIITNAVLPFSQTFRDMNTNSNPMSAVFLFLSSFFTCFSICYIASNVSWRGIKRVMGIIAVVFSVASFMTQIETLFFGADFPVLSKSDIILIMLATLPSIIAATLLSIKFFGEKELAVKENVRITFAIIIPRIIIVGVAYMAIYFLFGYFVAWQFEELRVFYSGSAENVGFIGQLVNNFQNNAIIYPFQFIRGILFATCVLPLLYMLQEKKAAFMISVCLVYLCTAVVLIIPNILFPDTVRWAHFIEMFSSMLLFGSIAGFILYIPNKP